MYNIAGHNTASPIVNPSADTAYFLKAEESRGCYAFDTVHIRVHHSPQINLGNDTSVCSGQSIILDAGPVFKIYQWSNGSTRQQLTVGSAATYWVKATTEQGCSSNDTFTLVAVNPLPVVPFDSSPGICVGTTRLLDAGNFASYQWHDGSTSRTYLATDTGIYHVNVMDVNGCKNADTVHITSTWASPTAFLPADTIICNYGSLVLRPTSTYRSYRWSTGTMAPDISVSTPGQYSLTVTNSNGCIGTDSILVKVKQCLTGLFVPSAFTPNADGKNDYLRAMLFGDTKQFDFRIYNRFGQMVFQTNNPLNGWNGKINSRSQDSGAYVWMCTYQLNNEPVKTEQGTTVLLR
jgi:gliding motility-associated-like protein